jgi:lysophospholipase
VQPDTLDVTNALTRRRNLPPHAVVEVRQMSDGWPVRTVRWQATNAARGSILFLGGRADFIEKYSEALWVWTQDHGAAVTAFDWRGQGLSGRQDVDPMKGHCGNFDRWVDDLDSLIAWFVGTQPGPHLAIGHSMGGHLLTRHLARRNSPLARAILLSPMFGLGNRLPLGPLARLMVAMGRGRQFAPLQRPYGAWQQRPARRGLLTSDADRFADEHWWIAENPERALGGVTWGWIDAASASVRLLSGSGVLEQIDKPVLVLTGEHERLVSPAATKLAVSRIPGAQLIEIAGAAHELLRETPELQSQVHAHIRSFLFGRSE